MKKIAIIGMLSLCAAGAYAQGTLVFSDYFVSGFNSQIFSPNTANPTVETQGNTASQTPVGVATYANSVPIGGSSGPSAPINYAYGNQFTVQIYWALNFNQPLSSLQPAPAYISTMSTSSAGGGNPTAGYIQPNTQSPDPGLVGVTQTVNDINNLGNLDSKATVALACWYNAGNTITSLAAASAAGVPYGESAKINLNNLGEAASIMTLNNGGVATPAQNPPVPAFTSFSLIAPVPEPATIALGVMGACAFLARRKK
jgi:hypothetical protein